MLSQGCDVFLIMWGPERWGLSETLTRNSSPPDSQAHGLIRLGQPSAASDLGIPPQTWYLQAVRLGSDTCPATPKLLQHQQERQSLIIIIPGLLDKGRSAWFSRLFTRCLHLLSQCQGGQVFKTQEVIQVVPRHVASAKAKPRFCSCQL